MRDPPVEVIDRRLSAIRLTVRQEPTDPAWVREQARAVRAQEAEMKTLAPKWETPASGLETQALGLEMRALVKARPRAAGAAHRGANPEASDRTGFA